MRREDLLDAFKAMTLLELSAFLKEFEATFDVTAAVMQPALIADIFPEDEAEPEKDEFDVILEAAGEKKIQVIKEVRTLTTLGLKEAKDLVDSAPSVVLKGATKDAASKAAEVLTAAGARVVTR